MEKIESTGLKGDKLVGNYVALIKYKVGDSSINERRKNRRRG
jgi:hypothetical protein